MNVTGPQILKELGIVCGKLEGVADSLKTLSERLDRHELRLESRVDANELRIRALEKGRGFMVGAATVVSVLIGWGINLLKELR